MHCSTFIGNSKQFSEVLVPLTSSYVTLAPYSQSFLLFLVLDILILLNHISFVVFNFTFSLCPRMLNIFLCVYWPFGYPLVKCLANFCVGFCFIFLLIFRRCLSSRYRSFCWTYMLQVTSSIMW